MVCACVFLLQKLKPETELEEKERAQEGRGERQERLDRTFTEPAASPAPGPNTTVTNTSDLNDSREINFEYLKHVVLKFMSSREAEVRAIYRVPVIVARPSHILDVYGLG